MKRNSSVRSHRKNAPLNSRSDPKNRSSRDKRKAVPSLENKESIARFLGRRDCELAQILAERDRRIAALQFALDQMQLKQECLRKRSLEMAESLSALHKSGIAESPLPSYSWDAMPPSTQRLKDDSVLYGLKKPDYDISLSVDLGRAQGSQTYQILPSLSRLCGILLFPFVEVPTCGGYFLLEIIAPDGKVLMWARQPIEELLPEMPVRFSFPPINIAGNEGWQLRVSAKDCPSGLYVLELRKEEDRLPFCGFVFQDANSSADQTPNVEGYLFDNTQSLARKRAVIFGAGEGGLRVMSKLILYDWDIRYFVDNRKEAWGTKVYGVEVRDPQSLLCRDFDVIMVASKPGKRAITEQLQRMGFVFGTDFMVAGL